MSDNSFGGEQELELVVHELPDRTVINTVDDFFDLELYEDINDPGAASFRIPNDAGETSNLVVGTLVTIKHLGQLIYAMLVESTEKVEISTSEEVEENTKVSGRGAGAVLEWSLVYPSNGLYSLPKETDRVFDWSSLHYDDSTWGTAKSIAVPGTGNTSWEKGFEEYPDKVFSHLIWADRVDCTSTWAPPGYAWFRKLFTVPNGITEIVVFGVGDDQLTIFIDGMEVLSKATGLPYDPDTAIIDITPGEHLIAIEGYNLAWGPGEPTPNTHTVVAGDTLWGIAQQYYDNGNSWRIIYDANQAQIKADAQAANLWNPQDPGHWIFPGQVLVLPGLNDFGVLNPAGVLATVYTMEGGEPTTLLMGTNDTWKCKAYESSPPGMTIGQALLRLLEERRIRGADTVPTITPTFTELTDSSGVAWPTYPQTSTKVGTDYSTFVKELAETYVDWYMSPNFELSVWLKDGRGVVTAVELQPSPEDPSLPDTGILVGLTRRSF